MLRPSRFSPVVLSSSVTCAGLAVVFLLASTVQLVVVAVPMCCCGGRAQPSPALPSPAQPTPSRAWPRGGARRGKAGCGGARWGEAGRGGGAAGCGGTPPQTILWTYDPAMCSTQRCLTSPTHLRASMVHSLSTFRIALRPDCRARPDSTPCRLALASQLVDLDPNVVCICALMIDGAHF